MGQQASQQASQKASAAQLPTTPPSRGTPVGNKVRGGRPSPRRDMRVPREETSEGRMMELVNARERWCLEKNTERKDLGDHLSIYPKYIEDEATRRSGDVGHLNLPKRQRTTRRLDR